MKISVISYSLTGNNEALAKSLAGALSAEHVSITEPGRRNMGTIGFDMMFKRTPKVSVPAVRPEERDLVVFVGPVWMGQVASPFRACFQELGPRLDKYAFVSVCGGADGPNPKLASELMERLGKGPVALIELHKASLLPPVPKPTRNDTMRYRISEAEVKLLTEKAVSGLKKVTV
jgi:hypothetical protein